MSTRLTSNAALAAVISTAAAILIAWNLTLALGDEHDQSKSPVDPSPSVSATPPSDNTVGPGWAGPFRVGADGNELAAAGLVVADPEVACGQAWETVENSYRTGMMLSFRLGDPDHLDQVFIKDPDAGGRSPWKTEEGAGVGTTLAALKRLYGASLEQHRWPDQDGGGPADTYTIFGPEGALSFDFGQIVTSDSARVVALEVTGSRDLAHLQAPDLGC